MYASRCAGQGVRNNRSMHSNLVIPVLPGDGIGPEITAATLRVLEHLNTKRSLGLSFETHDVGHAALRKSGTTLPDSVVEAVKSCEGFILGPVDHFSYPAGAKNPSGGLRILLDLYANIRPARSYEGIPHWGRTPMDLVIARENTEGFYADRNMHQGIGEFMPTPDLALSVRKISAQASRRTAVHKANVLKVTEGLFLREVRAVAAEHEDVAYDEQLVDSMAAMLVRDAARFDVVVTTNMYGDILSDEAAELSGSLGLAASINAGDAHCMAQAQHGSAPDIAGQDLANPASLILSAAMLLGWLGGRHNSKALREAQSMLEGTLSALMRDPATRTRDLGGKLGTRAFGEAVIKKLD